MLRFLSICADIEDTAGKIYEAMAEKIPCEERLKDIWLRMAQDEQEHAMQIRFAQRLPTRHVFKKQDPPLARVEQLALWAKEILQGVRTSPPSVQEALRISLKLEGDFAAAHVCGAEFIDESIKKMLQCLARADEAHIALLTDYCKEKVGGTPSLN